MPAPLRLQTHTRVRPDANRSLIRITCRGLEENTQIYNRRTHLGSRNLLYRDLGEVTGLPKIHSKFVQEVLPERVACFKSRHILDDSRLENVLTKFNVAEHISFASLKAERNVCAIGVQIEFEFALHILRIQIPDFVG